MMQETLQKQRAFFHSGKTLDLDWRIKQLQNLKKSIKKYEENLIWALRDDLGKSEFEAYTTEISMVYDEINTAIKHLPKWAEIRVEGGGGINQYPGKLLSYAEPLGLVLIMVSWNYPVQLVFSPLTAAIAAGNCAVIKPSERAPKTEAVVKTILEETFAPEHVSLFTGGPEVGKALLEEKFNHIFFVGNSEVGKEVMKKAAEHLTPVTLELGGKSPCIVDESADLEVAAKRIVWGKCLNSGQTCTAPDFLLVDKSVKEELVQHMIHYVQEFYPGDIFTNEDYPHIINEKELDRLTDMLEGEHILYGGRSDKASLKLEPTFVDQVDLSESKLMKQEIFGPILPIFEYEDLNKAITYLQNRPKPVACYLFTRNPEVEREVMGRVPFGGGCINDTMLHTTGAQIPFSGVGESGIGGGFHGKTGFETFSHRKVVLKQSNEIELPLRYAPYKKKVRLARTLI